MCIPNSLGRIHTESERRVMDELGGRLVGVWGLMRAYKTGSGYVWWEWRKRVELREWKKSSNTITGILFKNWIWWSLVNEYGPSLAMYMHMVMSVHVDELVPVWHAAAGLKQPTLWAWPSFIHLFSLITCSFPFFYSSVLFHWAVKFHIVLRLRQHVAFLGSNGVQLSTRL